MTGQSKTVAFLYSLRSALWPKQSEAVRGGYPCMCGRRSERDPNPIHRGLHLATPQHQHYPQKEGDGDDESKHISN